MKSIILELSGHILDSLTLAKVIDQIQLAGFDYEFNDLRIGRRKGDVSRAQITVKAPSDEDLNLLATQLRFYGVIPMPVGQVELAPITHPGEVPAAAYLRQNPPMEIFFEGSWHPVEGMECTVVVNKEGKARLCPVAEVTLEDRVVIGNQGLRAVSLGA